jgi:ribosomal protein S18 acetylase RimI-like enzyme
MVDIEIGELRRDELTAAGALLGRAYRDNPFMVAFLGDNADDRFAAMELIHGTRVSALAPPAIVARRNGDLVGVCGFDAPGEPPLPPEAMQQMMVTLSRLGPHVLPNMQVVLTEFGSRAPAERHWHLGPVGVLVDAQGAGVGSLMMTEFCARMDAEGDLAFLETDLPANVRLYERFGFETTDEADILGAHGWFMTRRPRG